MDWYIIFVRVQITTYTKPKGRDYNLNPLFKSNRTYY